MTIATNTYYNNAHEQYFNYMININMTRLLGAVPHQIGLFFCIEFRVESNQIIFVLLDEADLLLVKFGVVRGVSGNSFVCMNLLVG